MLENLSCGLDLWEFYIFDLSLLSLLRTSLGPDVVHGGRVFPPALRRVGHKFLL